MEKFSAASFVGSDGADDEIAKPGNGLKNNAESPVGKSPAGSRSGLEGVSVRLRCTLMIGVDVTLIFMQ